MDWKSIEQAIEATEVGILTGRYTANPYIDGLRLKQLKELIAERDALLAVARAAKKFEDADGLFLLRKGIAEALNALPEPLKAEIEKR